MRILLCYPPLFPTDSVAELNRRCDRDNAEVPIGMHILGAMMRERGHEVALQNFALSPWRDTLAWIEEFKPDLFATTCYTFHRHTVGRLTREVRERCPRARIVVGGVHVSPMPEEVLDRWRWVDFVAVSESEVAFPDLVERLESESDLEGILGIAHRDESGSPVFAGRAPVVADLDTLPIGAEHWPHWILSTARGCPFVCNFCSSPSIWGRKVRERSPAHVVRELEILKRHGLKQVAFKDETFTFKRSRVADLCQAIIDADLNLWWSCDTRADCLDEERLAWLRRAGCFEISLGVETGSPDLIHYYNKREKPEKVVEATRLARKFGIIVRHYFIVGAPEETEKTIGDTLNLIEESRPHRVFLAPLSVLPGTTLHNEMKEKRGWDDSVWFEREDEWMLADPQMRHTRLKNYGRLIERYHNSGTSAKVEGLLFPLSEEELRGACERVPDAFAVHYDLGQHLMAEGRLGEAAQALGRSVDLHPNLGKAWIDLGVCLKTLDQIDGALAAWEKVDGIDGEQPINRAVALLHRAGVLAEQGAPEDALDLCRRSAEENPDLVEAHFLATQILMSQRRLDEACDVARAWLERTPRDSRAFNVLGGCHYLCGEVEDALALFEQAHTCAPDDPEILVNMSKLNLKLARPDEARRCASEVLAHQPGSAVARTILDACATGRA